MARGRIALLLGQADEAYQSELISGFRARIQRCLFFHVYKISKQQRTGKR